jgi:Zn finger protein HypA/HybF involved in hydrogenase expression
MFSKNKKTMTAGERAHVSRVKDLPCMVCGAAGPSEAHEIEQGQWFLSVALCPDCHRGSRNGIHGEKVMWRTLKMTEMDALNETLRRLM